jgi:hypothetical protein
VSDPIVKNPIQMYGPSGPVAFDHAVLPHITEVKANDDDESPVTPAQDAADAPADADATTTPDAESNNDSGQHAANDGTGKKPPAKP